MDRQQRSPCGFTPGGSAGCGAAVVSGESAMRLSVTSTTGSGLELSVPRGETVEGLKTSLSQKLRLPRNRIVLLHKDRQLNAGKLLDLGVADECKLTLVPTIEAGLACQTTRTERTMVQALESLTETQISDFLSGRSPLTLSLGIGAHMMYVQLQLAAQNVAGQQQQQQQQQQHRQPGALSSSEVQAGLAEATSMTHPSSTSAPSPTNTPASPTSPPSHTSSPAPQSPPPTQLKSRTSFNLTAPSTHLSNRTPAICHSSPRHSYPAHPVDTPSPVRSSLSLPSDRLLPSFPRLPAAPFCSPSPTCSSPGPQSPAAASTFPESNDHALSTAKLCQQPGAVIESFVNHSPGLFSGTFSGSLDPISQRSISHPRRGIAIILQILNDLFSATCHHQGAPPTLAQLHCLAPSLPVSPLFTAEEPSKATSDPLVTQRTESPHFSKAPGQPEPTLLEGYPQQSSTEENLTLRCKLEQLQFLMHQRRLRRRSRGGTHPSKTSHPYQHRHHHPWSPGRQRTASPDNLKLQVTEEPPWKPEMTSDLVVV